MIRAVGLVVILASFMCGWLWISYDHSVNRSYISEEMGSVVISIERGQSLNQIVTTLEKQHVVEAKWFKWLVRVEGAGNKIQAGEYEFSPGLTPKQILAYLIKGRVNQYAITIIEGQTFKEILQELNNHPAIKQTLDANAAMEKHLQQLKVTEKNLEGLLMPETYFFTRGTEDKKLVLRAYRAMQAYVNTQWLKKDKDLRLKSVYEVLILASIVEKETGAADERKKIAGLFLRRLDIGMRLQTDPTVIYGMGERFKGDIRFRDLRKDTPYNTYTRFGLPPTPIAMPSKASIDAVLHPEATKSLYFVSKGNGRHVFSETLVQHNNAVNKYQRGK